MTASRTIATVQKSNSEEIRVSVASQHGDALIDVRIFSPSRTSQGEPRPTNRGVCLTCAKLPALIEALELAHREASR